jgi:hypothetical protein
MDEKHRGKPLFQRLLIEMSMEILVLFPPKFLSPQTTLVGQNTSLIPAISHIGKQLARRYFKI